MSTANTSKDLWSALVIQGVVTLMFGIAAVFWPSLTIVTLLYLFAAFILVSGIFGLVRGVMNIGKGGWWPLELLLGLFELGVGVYLLRHPHVTFASFILLIGFALIARGVVDMVSTFFEGNLGATDRILRFIIGGLALLAGIVILFQPVTAGVAFVWILGLYAIVAGSLEIALASDYKKTIEKR